jgi:hypothetical protein
MKVEINARQMGKTLTYLKAVSERLDEGTKKVISEKAKEMMLISEKQLVEQHKKYLSSGTVNPMIDVLFKEVVRKSRRK